MSFITSWAQSIIVAVIIVTIIEMILPNGSNSKYIKTVAGIFVLFTIISPFINKIINNSNNEIIDVNSYINTSNNETLQTSTVLNNNDAIKKMYEENLKIDIKSKLSQKGYIVGNIGLEILNNKEYTLNKINIKIAQKSETANQNAGSNVTTIVENIENIKINIGGSSKDENKTEEKSVISETEKRKIKEYLCSVYEVNENNIYVN